MTALRRYFEREGWGSQKRLAVRVGSSSSYLGEIADGKVFAGKELAKAIERETGIAAAILTGLEPDLPASQSEDAA